MMYVRLPGPPAGVSEMTEAGIPETATPLALQPALIVEDDRNAQQRLSRILATLDVPQDAICCANDLAAAEEYLAARPFAIGLIDIELPDGSGIEFVRRLRERGVPTATVIVSTFATQDLIVAALQAGVVGYLLKERDDEELAASLRSIRRGGAPIDPFVARHILRLIAHAPARTDAAVPAPKESEPLTEPLTRREEEILQFVAQGLISREIAERLSRSTLTVEGHIKSIFRKLQVNTRTKAIYQARTLGLLR